MTLAKNISDLMNEVNIDDKKLSESTGVSAATIKKIRLGLSLNPTIETLIPLAKFFDVSVSQLIGEVSINDGPSDNKKQIPLLRWHDIETKDIKSLCIISNILLDTDEPENCFATQILSDKYRQPFCKDTFIIINTNQTPDDGDFVLCQFNNKLEICNILSKLGQKYVISMVAGSQDPIKLDSLDKYIGTIIETRNVLQIENQAIKNKQSIANKFLELNPIKILLN